MPLTPRMRSAAIPLLVFALGLAVLGLAASLMLGRPATGTSTVGGPFTLVNQDGRTVTDRDFSGTPHLVFFGFTHCPDICPTTLQQISDVLVALGPKGRDVKALFVSVDPERDTPRRSRSTCRASIPASSG